MSARTVKGLKKAPCWKWSFSLGSRVSKGLLACAEEWDRPASRIVDEALYEYLNSRRVPASVREKMRDHAA